jgi:NAD(P)-dependent dehydrogenase (short-subunit alcohol dehydrogenase family)
MEPFTNKVVLVTGGGAGIGRAAALEFAAQGARVVVTGRRPEPLSALAREHPNLTFVVADASRAEDAPRAVQESIDRCGRLDVLVNNAAAGAILPLAVAAAKDVAEIFATNVIARRYSARSARSSWAR